MAQLYCKRTPTVAYEYYLESRQQPHKHMTDVVPGWSGDLATLVL